MTGGISSLRKSPMSKTFSPTIRTPNSGSAKILHYHDSLYGVLGVFQGAPLRLDIPAWMDLAFAGVPESVAARSIEDCAVRTWVLPLGEPFRHSSRIRTSLCSRMSFARNSTATTGLRRKTIFIRYGRAGEVAAQGLLRPRPDAYQRNRRPAEANRGTQAAHPAYLTRVLPQNSCFADKQAAPPIKLHPIPRCRPLLRNSCYEFRDEQAAPQKMSASTQTVETCASLGLNTHLGTRYSPTVPDWSRAPRTLLQCMRARCWAWSNCRLKQR